MKKGLSIVIPILNENHNIIILVNQIKKYLKKIRYEIIFIDDNSTDNSLKTLKILKKKIKKFHFIFTMVQEILRNHVFWV